MIEMEGNRLSEDPLNVCFVILHYQNVDVTHQCIKNLKNMRYEGEINIVIVDNHSPNQSGVLLRDYYISDNKINVILNSENSGFAKGNNIGYIFAKNELNANIIVHLNSDLMIYDKEFLNKLISAKNKFNNISIMGPDILSLDIKHQNPLRKQAVSDFKLLEYFIKNNALQIIYRIPFINNIYINSNYYKKKQTISNEFWNSNQSNVVLHGSCIIFFDNWIISEEVAFPPITFLFMEEDILFDYARIKGHTTLYNSEMKVVHLEDSSIDSANYSDLEKQKFLMRHQRNSMLSLMRLRRNFKKGIKLW